MSLVQPALVRRIAVLIAAVAVAVVGVGLGGVGTPVGAQDAERRELEQARARIQELDSEIDRAEAAAADAEADLEDAERVLREAEAVVNEVATRVDEQRDAVADAERRYQQVVAEARAVEEAFADRVAQIYKEGPALTFETLLASEEADDVLDRSLFLQQLSAADQVDLQTLRAARASVAAEQQRFEQERERLEALLAEEREFLAEVEELRERRALKAVAAEEHLHALEEEHGALEEDTAALEELIRSKEQEQEQEQEQREASAAAAAPPAEPTRRASTGAASSSGYVWPICAPVTSEYGRRWGRMHEGIDLGAPTGTPIGASKAGTVIYAGWRGGYGQMVLISHGDGVVTAYAHMSRVGTSNGASVSAGATIGYVGSTGNSTGPHLHLETRVNGAAVNPRQYLAGGPC